MKFRSNPLTTEVGALGSDQRINLIELAKRKISEYDGVMPSSLSFCPVRCRPYREYRTQDALVMTWNNLRFNDSKVDQLERVLVSLKAPNEVETRRDAWGRAVRPRAYKSTSFASHESTRGYLLSDDPSTNLGLFLVRKFNSGNEARRLLRSERGRWLDSGNTFAELRLPLNETNFEALEYVVRISTILRGKPVENLQELISDLYRSLVLQSVDQKKQSDLAGVDEILDFMRWTSLGGSMIPLASHYGLKDRSVMLAGVYGVGKTTIAKVLAAESTNSIFVPIEASALVSSLFEKKGDPLSLFQGVERLQNRTGVTVSLFCDDIESAMVDSKYYEGIPQYHAGTSTLLNRLQGISGGNTLLSGSTNNPLIIDPRFLEFGRIGYVLHVPLPNNSARKKTFEIHTRDKPVSKVNFSSLVSETEGFSNRAIEEVCHKAGEQALRRAARKIKQAGETEFDAAKRVTLDIAKDFQVGQGDFTTGLEIVRRHVRVSKTKRLDKEIADFCRNHNEQIGFR